MQNKKQKLLDRLKFLYLFVFVLTIILVIPPHLFSPPYLMPFRFPHYLEMMPTFLGISWPMTFEIYHYGLYTLALIGTLNLLGILFYPKLEQIALASSIIGLFLMLLMILFFFFVFISVNPLTAIIYGLYSVVLLIVDWLTFKALIKPRTTA